MEEVILKTEGIVKTYNGNRVLNDLSMTINRGDIYGFVGENGSGKTTVIRVVTGLIKFEAGSYQLFGIDSKNPEILKARKKISAIVESPSIYTNMNAKDNLRMQSMILGIQDEGRIQWALDIVGLRDLYESNKPAGNFSLGMRQRLGIAMALLSQAEFLILDEPLNGLDPEGIKELRDILKKLAQKENVGIIISSHNLSELESFCNKIVIIKNGEIVEENKLSNFKKIEESYIIEVDNITKIKEIEFEKINENNIRIHVNKKEIPAIIKKLVENNIKIYTVREETITLEDAFLKRTGGNIID